MTRRDASKVKKGAKPGYSHDEVYARYKEQVPNNMDFTAPRSERVFPMPGFLKSLFAPMLERPEKEMICLEFMFNATVVVIPRESSTTRFPFPGLVSTWRLTLLTLTCIPRSDLPELVPSAPCPAPYG